MSGSQTALGRLLSQLQWWEAGLVLAAVFAILWLGAWALTTPRFSGWRRWAILAVIVASWFTPVKMGPRAIMDALALGARNMATTAVLLCAVGLVVNVIATAGIGNTFSLMVTEWAGGSLLIAIGS